METKLVVDEADTSKVSFQAEVDRVSKILCQGAKLMLVYKRTSSYFHASFTNTSISIASA
jgi:hypothetical protein